MKRPVAITVFGVLFIIVGSYFVCRAVRELMWLAKPTHLKNSIIFSAVWKKLFWGLPPVVAGVGVLKLKKWALGIVHLINILWIAMGIAIGFWRGAFETREILQFVCNIVVFWYFLRPSVMMRFR